MNTNSHATKLLNESFAARLGTFAFLALFALFALPLSVLCLPGFIYYWRRNLTITLLGIAIYYPLMFGTLVNVGMSTVDAACLVAIGLVVFLPRYIPPQFRYLSAANRHAIKMALAEFSVAQLALPNLPKCRIYESNDSQCVVMIPHLSRYRPAPISFFAVPHKSGNVRHIGTGQCAWGIRPEDIWNRHRNESPTSF